MKEIYTLDTRPNCTDQIDDAEQYLLCLSPDEFCEQTVHDSEEGYGVVKITPLRGLFAVIFATPVQFIFELLCIYLVKIKNNNEKVSENCKILSFQIFMTMVYCYLIFQAIHDLYEVLTFGRPGLVFTSFIFCLMFDQAKSFISLAVIYCIVVRRFMHLDINEGEYVEQNLDRNVKQENAIPKLKIFCLKFLESTPVETVSMIIISLYTFFILFWLTHAEFVDGNGVDEKILAQIDNVFLTFFLVEIVLKTFASNLMYLYDGFNLFDAFIVILSQVLNLMGIIIKGISVLRLIRVVVIILRKITGNQSKLRHQNKNNNPVESVIKILEQIIELEDISHSVKKEAKWAIELIESNKLYELNFDMSNEQKNMDMDAKAWVNITTETASDTTKWFEVDLDDFLKEIHRENDEIDPQKAEEEEEKLKQIIDVPPRIFNLVLVMMQDFDKWNFDIFKYQETLGDVTLLHFGMKLFQQYGLLDKFSIADNNFKNLLNSIKNECYETT